MGVANFRPSTICTHQDISMLCGTPVKSYSLQGYGARETGILASWTSCHVLSPLEHVEESEETMAVPAECLEEMKTRDREKPTVSLLNPSTQTTILSCEGYSNLINLLRVTAYVLKFISAIKECKTRTSSTSSPANCTLTAEDINLALMYWIKASQSPMSGTKDFHLWSNQFGLFRDSSGLW